MISLQIHISRRSYFLYQTSSHHFRLELYCVLGKLCDFVVNIKKILAILNLVSMLPLVEQELLFEFTPGFLWVSVYCFVDHCLSFCSFSFGHCVVCPSVFWSLCCLSFFDLRILITPLMSSKSSWTEKLKMSCWIYLYVLVNIFVYITNAIIIFICLTINWYRFVRKLTCSQYRFVLSLSYLVIY